MNRIVLIISLCAALSFTGTRLSAKPKVRASAESPADSMAVKLMDAGFLNVRSASTADFRAYSLETD